MDHQLKETTDITVIKPVITQSNYKLIKLSKELENSSVLEVTGFSFVSGWFRRDQW